MFQMGDAGASDGSNGDNGSDPEVVVDDDNK